MTGVFIGKHGARQRILSLLLLPKSTAAQPTPSLYRCVAPNATCTTAPTWHRSLKGAPLFARFNPRRQRLRAHGRIDGGAIVPLTDAGAGTVRWLDINNQTRVEMRATRAQHPFDPRRQSKASKRTAENSRREIAAHKPDFPAHP